MHAETIDALIEQVQDAANNTGDSDYDPVMLGFTDGLNDNGNPFYYDEWHHVFNVNKMELAHNRI